jgi:hypothetical protein
LAGERLSQAESEVVPSLLSRDEEWAQRVASDAAERFAKHAAPAYDMSHVLKSMDPNNLGVIRGAAAGAYMLSGQGAKEAWQHANVVEAVVGVGGAALMLSPHAPSNFQAPTEGPGTVIEGSRFSLSPPKATLELAREIANVERGAMRTSRTIVLIETNQGKTFVSGGGSDLSAGQVALAEEKNLTPVAPLPGIHAEGKGILGQHMLFCEPTRGVSTNKICAHCETDYIRPFGGTVLPGRFEFRF